MSISDIIEQYLKEIVYANEEKVAEIKRSELANQFKCVPSQINYVINTRFTIEKGYIIESKRGGGGYIRISRVEHQSDVELLNELISLVHPSVTQQAAIDILERLHSKKLITSREANLFIGVLSRQTLNISLPERDILRSRILVDVLTSLKYMK